MLPLLRMEDVNDDMPVVEENPATVLIAADLFGFKILFLATHFLDVIGERFHLYPRAARGHNKKIGEARLLGQVDDLNVAGLFLFETFDNLIFEKFSIHNLNPLSMFSLF